MPVEYRNEQCLGAASSGTVVQVVVDAWGVTSVVGPLTVAESVEINVHQNQLRFPALSMSTIR